MLNEFKDGDIVTLNSGGPLMTVAYTYEEGDETMVATHWFVMSVGAQWTGPEVGSFPLQSLKKADLKK